MAQKVDSLDLLELKRQPQKDYNIHLFACLVMPHSFLFIPLLSF